jgi:hypothetical protein
MAAIANPEKMADGLFNMEENGSEFGLVSAIVS